MVDPHKIESILGVSRGQVHLRILPEGQFTGFVLSMNQLCYPPQTKLQEGNVFPQVCLFTGALASQRAS